MQFKRICYSRPTLLHFFLSGKCSLFCRNKKLIWSHIMSYIGFLFHSALRGGHNDTCQVKQKFQGYRAFLILPCPIPPLPTPPCLTQKEEYFS